MPKLTPQKQKWWEVHSRIIVIGLFTYSLIIMFIDIAYFEKTHSLLYFYVLCNAVMLFRVFGANFWTYVLHVGAMVVLLIWLLTKDLDYLIFWFLIPLVAQLLLALHLLLFRAGKTLDEKACRTGIHALLGHYVVTIYFFVSCYLCHAVGSKDTQVLLEAMYYLIFLFIVLTPHLMTSNQIVRQAAESVKGTKVLESRTV